MYEIDKPQNWMTEETMVKVKTMSTGAATIFIKKYKETIFVTNVIYN